jgi:hypothetical protein
MDPPRKNPPWPGSKPFMEIIIVGMVKALCQGKMIFLDFPEA